MENYHQKPAGIKDQSNMPGWFLNPGRGRQTSSGDGEGTSSDMEGDPRANMEVLARMT